MSAAVSKVSKHGEAKHYPVMGRPPKYNKQVVETAKRCISELILTDEETAKVIGIAPATWYRWLHEHPEFKEAVTRTKEIANAVIEASVAKRAQGYSVQAVKVFMTTETTETVSKRGTRKIVRKQVPVTVEHLEHIPGEVRAQQLWLENRNPQRWHRNIGNEPPPSVPTEEAEARRVAWRKLVEAIEDSAAKGVPLLQGPDVIDITPKEVDSPLSTAAAAAPPAKKKANGNGSNGHGGNGHG